MCKLYWSFNRQNITWPFPLFFTKHRIKFGVQTQWLIHPRCLVTFISLSPFKAISNSFGKEARHNQLIYVNKHMWEHGRKTFFYGKYLDNIFYIYFSTYICLNYDIFFRMKCLKWAMHWVLTLTSFQMTCRNMQ